MIFTEIYKSRYLLLIELTLLFLITLNNLVPFFILFSSILLFAIVYYTFNSPIVAIHILIFSILVDSFIPIGRNTAGPSLLVVEFFFIIFLIMGIIWLLLNLDKKFSIPFLILIWLPFLIWSLPIGLTVGIEKLNVMVFWKNYFAGFFALSLTFFAVQNKRHLKSLLIGIAIWGLLLSLIELKVLFELGGFTTGIVDLFFRKNLLTVGWGKSNYLASFFVIIIPVSIGYLFYTKSKGLRILLIITLVFMSFALTLTLSRGGILSLLIALIILFSRIVKFRTLLPFIALLLLLTVIVILNPLTFVLIDRISSLDTSGSYFSRINFYSVVWNTFLKHPITGVGFGNLGYYAQFVLGPDSSTSAHNIVLGMLGETGIVGALFYLSILGTLFIKVFSGFKSECDSSLKILRWGFVSAIIGGFLHSLMEPTLEGLQFSIMFWTLAGVYFKLDLLKIPDN